MTQHTPGPWNCAQATAVYANGRWIADTSQPGAFTEEQAANARLIAAAPELLTALVKVIGHAGDIYVDSDGYAHIDLANDLIIAARDAIAKATQA